MKKRARIISVRTTQDEQVIIELHMTDDNIFETCPFFVGDTVNLEHYNDHSAAVAALQNMKPMYLKK